MAIAGRNTLAQLPRKKTSVEIDGTTFLLREMSGAERDTFESMAVKEVKEEVTDDKGKTKNEYRRVVDPMYLRARLVALCWVDEKGARVYPDDEVEILAREIPASHLGQLFEAAQKLNGLDADAVEAARKN